MPAGTVVVSNLSLEKSHSATVRGPRANDLKSLENLTEIANILQNSLVAALAFRRFENFLLPPAPLGTGQGPPVVRLQGVEQCPPTRPRPKRLARPRSW
jgi:hypothetical protein